MLHCEQAVGSYDEAVCPESLKYKQNYKSTLQGLSCAHIGYISAPPGIVYVGGSRFM